MQFRPKLSALHARAELIIPWLVNGSLPAEAEAAVREHIESCPRCRQDYEEQLRVREAMCAEGPLVFAAESSYQKLLARMESQDANTSPADPQPRVPVTDLRRPRVMRQFRETPPVVRWLAAAVILQAFALGLGAWAWQSSGADGGARYATLTSASPSYASGPRARVLFRTDLSVGDLQAVLRAAGAHIIDGPADGNVYTLGFAQPPGSRAALSKRIAGLRANPAVLFAEPVQDGVR
ncbi:MAG TPA: zf-HC2 domain-containing protein [Steroidobacteraceae bacterium]|nr:zf-HC2 domain-containing protein [Steroidobacteraceae bacterium]